MYGSCLGGPDTGDTHLSQPVTLIPAPKCKDILIAPFRRNPQIEQITPEYEVLLAGSIDAAFCVQDVVLQILIQYSMAILPSIKPIHN